MTARNAMHRSVTTRSFLLLSVFLPACTGTAETSSSNNGVSAGDTIVPGDDNILPGDTYVASGDTYVPSGDTYVPPGDTYVPPGDTYVSPGDTYVSPGDTPGVDYLMYVDFDSEVSGHTVTNSDIIDWFGADSGEGITNGTINVVTDPSGDAARGNVMRVFRAAGTYSNSSVSGGQWRSRTSLMGGAAEYPELYFSVDVYIPTVNAWTKEQKFPGLLAGPWENSAWPNKFSHRAILIGPPARPDGTIRSYLYDANYAGKSYSTTGLLTQGNWHTIETYVKENTVGQANGLVKIWLDGTQIHSRSDREWRTDSGLRLDGLYFTFSFGGNDSTFNVPADRYDYYDNFILSTDPITH